MTCFAWALKFDHYKQTGRWTDTQLHTTINHSDSCLLILPLPWPQLVKVHDSMFRVRSAIHIRRFKPNSHVVCNICHPNPMCGASEGSFYICHCPGDNVFGCLWMSFRREWLHPKTLDDENGFTGLSEANEWTCLYKLCCIGKSWCNYCGLLTHFPNRTRSWKSRHGWIRDL